MSDDTETLPTADARLIAAQYQSSGYVGKTFASFASGCRVSYEAFLAECDMTASEVGFDSYDDMRLLRDYAVNTEDSVWK